MVTDGNGRAAALSGKVGSRGISPAATAQCAQQATPAIECDGAPVRHMFMSRSMSPNFCSAIGAAVKNVGSDVPLARAPTADAWRKFNEQYPEVSPLAGHRGNPAREQALIEFTYKEDPDGLKCPIASHMRRVNTRDGLAPTGTEGSVLNNRRRILRRGLPYGDSSDGAPTLGEHGIVMLVVCASLFRQYEFVQQQWLNYGLDSNAGNDTCPLVGNHSTGAGGPKAKFVIASDPKTGRPPFIVEGIPQFVETRGGEYFFVPSMTALRMIGMGTVDPT